MKSCLSRCVRSLLRLEDSEDEEDNEEKDYGTRNCHVVWRARVASDLCVDCKEPNKIKIVTETRAKQTTENIFDCKVLLPSGNVFYNQFSKDMAYIGEQM